MGRYAFAFQELTAGTVSIEIGSETQGSRLRMPTIYAYETIEDRAWQLGANDNYTWKDVVFWTDGFYSNNAEITDVNGTVRGRLAEYLGFLRNSMQDLPENFILHSGQYLITIINNGIYYET